MHRKVIRLYRSEGSRAVVARALKKLARLVWDTNSAYWFRRDLSPPLPEVVPAIPVEIDLFARDETAAWLRGYEEPWVFNEREVETASRENHYYPNVKYRGQIIAYGKVGMGNVYIHDYKACLRFASDTAFIYDTYVRPEYRGMKIASFLVSSIMRFLQENGVRILGCHIPPWNTGSLNLYTKLGFKKIRYVRYLRLLGIRMFTARPGLSWGTTGVVTPRQLTVHVL